MPNLKEALEFVKGRFIDHKTIDGCEIHQHSFDTTSYIENCIRILYEEAIRPKAILPEEPTEEVIKLFRKKYDELRWDAPNIHRDWEQRCFKAMYAALTTPPKPKTTRVWCCAWIAGKNIPATRIVTTFMSQENAENNREAAIRLGYTHISPVYEAEVPA